MLVSAHVTNYDSEQKLFENATLPAFISEKHSQAQERISALGLGRGERVRVGY